MPEGDDNDEQHVILNCVDDAIVADAHAKTRPPLKCLGARRPWVVAQKGDCATDSVTMLMVDPFERARRGRRDLDAVGHYQPRSALT